MKPQTSVPSLSMGVAVPAVHRNVAGRSRRPSKHILDIAAVILPEVDRRLRRMYGPVAAGSIPLGNKRNPLDELVYIQLSVRTRETSYQSTYLALRRLVGGAWERLLSVSDLTAIPLMHSGGMARVKLTRLRMQFASLRERFGRVTLAPIKKMTTAQAEATLLSLPGVGPKVARCVLLYSLGREVFPVDSNCHRVLARLGFLPRDIDIKAAHDFLQELVPIRHRRTLHVNLVHHGRTICTVGAPRCGSCPILALCPTGTRLTRTDTKSHVRYK